MSLQGQLVSMWQDLSQSELSLNQQLSEFYDTLLSTWHSQLQWSNQVRHSTVQDRHLTSCTSVTSSNNANTLFEMAG